MTLEIFVQARMGSTRLPGKVMKRVLNKPLLEFLIERLKQIKSAPPIVVLTTQDPKDDVIVSYCKDHTIPFFRGPEEDVLTRYWLAAKERHPQYIMRVTADCPLIDPSILDEMITEYMTKKPDYLSNSIKRSFPRGLDAEIFSYEALEKANSEGKDPYEREHVTPYIYNHSEQFKILNFESSIPLEHHRWTVDTPEDFELVRLILENLYPKNPQFKLKDILALLDQHPDWSKINAHIKQKSNQNLI